MHVALAIVALVAVVTFVSQVSRRLPLPAPLLLTVVGVGASFIPGVPQFQLSPEVVLLGFLPPLLYAAAIESSLLDFRRNARPIGLLSVGLVLVTTGVVGLVVHAVLPVGWPAAFALGAVVAPPDAVAATAVARRVGMPRRMVTILQGESLLNDATALVALRTAIAGIGGTISGLSAGVGFVVTGLGGVVVGVAVAYATGWVRKHLQDNITETAVSIITPFIAYLVAEEAQVSGVLAVVVTGLMLGHKSHLMQSASSRIFERTNWATFQFLLENTVFLLIGLQVRGIVDAAANSSLSGGTITLACVATILTVIGVRIVWVFPATYLPRLIPAVGRRDPFPPWTIPAAVSWAGMRGVVTLAAAFILPAQTANREVLILIALLVVGATLLVQGASLPWVLRHLGLGSPDPAEDALQAASIQQRASSAGQRRLSEVVTPNDRPEVVERARRRSEQRSEALWERLGGSDETPSQEYARLRIAMIRAEREEVLRLRDTGLVDDEVLRQVFAAIDVEETVLDKSQSTWTGQDREEELTARVVTGCSHLRHLQETPTPETPEGCAECLAEGLDWVHLRLCQTCGHVGCCDSSIGKHATAHHHETDHPVIRSFEPGEAWRWCYIDEILG